MKPLILFSLMVTILLTGCGGAVRTAPEPLNNETLYPTITLTPFQPQLNTPLPDPTSTFTSTTTDLPSATPNFHSNATPASTPSLEPPESDSLNVPVLLYHQIAVPPSKNPYYTTPENFEAQMNLLYSEGYRTISIEMFVRAIKDGKQLPEKPIIITFDDGNISVITTAFPIMNKYNFTGVAYIVYKYLGAAGSMDASQVKTLAENGWEIGSHGFTHADLIDHEERQRKEIVTSRVSLEQELGVPVLTFAYPYGRFNSNTVDLVKRAGYFAAFGVETNQKPELRNLFYLDRVEVKGDYDLAQFSSLLSGPGKSIQTSSSTLQP